MIFLLFLWESKRERTPSEWKKKKQKPKIMASGPITPWQTYEETVTDFIFLGSKITEDGDCSHELKDTFSLEEKL